MLIGAFSGRKKRLADNFAALKVGHRRNNLLLFFALRVDLHFAPSRIGGRDKFLAYR